MARKTRAQHNLGEPSRKDLKRKRPENDDDVEDTIQLNDVVGESISGNITDGAEVQAPTSKISLSFSTPAFESRYYELKMSTRTMFFSKPRNISILDKCDLTVLLEKLRISYLSEISRFCYPTYVVEFYVNIHKDKFDNYISVVKSRRLV